MPLFFAAALAFAPPTPAAAPIEVPFRMGDRAIIVDAEVNGRQVSLMFDTGFSGWIQVDDTTPLGAPTGKTTLRDFVGQMDADTVRLKSLKLGGRSVAIEPGADAVVSSGSDYSAAYNTHVDGVMGFSVIKNNIVEINFERSRFIIYPPSFDVSKLPTDGKKTFLNKLLPIGSASLEMLVTTASGGAMTLALDTGNAFYSTTHKDVLERLGLWKSGVEPKFVKQSGVASGAVDSFMFRMPPVNIFGVPVESSVWDIIDLPSSSAEGDGTVGIGFLKNFNIVMDYGRRRVRLTNWTGRSTDDEEGEVGIGAVYDPGSKRTIVYRVAPESPAAAAGIKRGDVLVAVDGREVANVGWRRIARLFTGAPGSKVKVATSRAGALKTVELTRIALVNEPPKG